MKTIIEITNGSVYVYRNTEKHFNIIKDQLSGRQINGDEIDKECLLSLDEDSHIIIDGDVLCQ